MQKWEYTLRYESLYVWSEPDRKGKRTFEGNSARALWTEKASEGRTAFDEMKKLGEEGWELVAAVPIGLGRDGGITPTDYILFTYKRPL